MGPIPVVLADIPSPFPASTDTDFGERVITAVDSDNFLTFPNVSAQKKQSTDAQSSSELRKPFSNQLKNNENDSKEKRVNQEVSVPSTQHQKHVDHPVKTASTKKMVTLDEPFNNLFPNKSNAQNNAIDQLVPSIKSMIMSESKASSPAQTVLTPWSPAFLPGLTPVEKGRSVLQYQDELGVIPLLKSGATQAANAPVVTPSSQLNQKASETLLKLRQHTNGANGDSVLDDATVNALLDPNRFSLPSEYSITDDTKNLFPELTPQVQGILADKGTFTAPYLQSVTSRFNGDIVPFKASLLSLMLSNFSIKSSEHDVGSRKAGVSEARGAYLPQLSSILSVGKERIQNSNSADSNQGYNEIDFLLSQLITDFGKTSATINVATQEYKKALNTLFATKQNVLLKGIEAFTNVVRDSDILQLSIKNSKSIREQLLVEEKRVHLGRGYATDVLELKARLSASKSRVVIAKRNLMISRSQYNALFQRYPGDLTDVNMPPVPRKIMPRSLQVAEAQAELTNTQLVELRRERDIAQAQLANAKSGFGPTLSVVGESLLKNNVDGIAGQRHENSIGLELTYQLYRGGADVAAIRAAREKLYSIQDSYRDAQFKVNAEIETEWHNWQAAESSAVYLTQQSEELELFLKLAEKERLLGRRSLLDILVADTNQINAETSAVTARAEAVTASYTLLETIGTLQLIVVP